MQLTYLPSSLFAASCDIPRRLFSGNKKAYLALDYHGSFSNFFCLKTFFQRFCLRN